MGQPSQPQLRLAVRFLAFGFALAVFLMAVQRHHGSDWSEDAVLATLVVGLALNLYEVRRG